MSQTLPGRFLVVVIVVLCLIPGTLDAVAAQVVTAGYETRLSLGGPVIFDDSQFVTGHGAPEGSDRLVCVRFTAASCRGGGILLLRGDRRERWGLALRDAVSELAIQHGRRPRGLE